MSRRVRRCTGYGTVVLLAPLFCPMLASALDIEVRAAARALACVDVEAVGQRIRARWPALPSQQLKLAAITARTGQERALVIAVTSGSVAAERQLALEPASCAEVSDAVAVVATVLAQSVWDEAQAGATPSADSVAEDGPAESTRGIEASQRSAGSESAESTRGFEASPGTAFRGAAEGSASTIRAAEAAPAQRLAGVSASGARGADAPAPAGARPAALSQNAASSQGIGTPASRSVVPRARVAATRSVDEVAPGAHTRLASRSPDEPGRGPQLLLGLGAGVRSGFLPELGPWPYAAFGLRWPSRVSAELRAGVALPQQRLVAEGQLRFAAYSLALAGCAAPLSFAQGLSLCAELQSGLVHAAAAGLQLGNLERNELTLRAAARLAFDAELGRSAGRLGVWADLGRALAKPSFVVHDPMGARVAEFVSSTWGVGAGLGYSLLL